MRRNAIAVIIAVPLLLGALVVAIPRVSGAFTTPEPPSAEADFVRRVNDLRSAEGVSELRVDEELEGQARIWAAKMAEEGEISHADSLATGLTSDWSKLGENVGMGTDVANVQKAFVESPSHFANILDPSYTHIGVGVVVSDGKIFTVHRFMTAAGPPPAAAPTAITEGQPSS
jgi:uncharacterized protein YkwD